MCNPVSKRILAVYGTETGATKSEAKDIVESWKTKQNLKGPGAVTLMEGNEAAEQFDTINKTNYDIIVVMTSSYGDGEAPSGFGKFLYHIYTAAADAKKNTDAAVLSGMEHSVLGFGSTVYYTFQNVPRLCDRLLGESGSRRFLMRTEIDEMGDFDENKDKIAAWSDAVVKHAKESSDSTSEEDDVCEWKSPESEVYEKKLGPDGYEIGAGPGENSSFIAIVVAILVAGVAYYIYNPKVIDALMGKEQSE